MHKIIVLTGVTAILFCQRIIAQAPVVAVTATHDTTTVIYHNLTAILGAFPEEISLLHTKLEQPQEHIIQQIHFTEGLLNGRKVVLAQTGIGKVNAAITTTLLLEHFKPREVLFSGIAGGTNPALLPGDIVIGTKVAYHDYGTLTPDSLLRRPTRNMVTQEENPIYFPSDSTLIQLAIQSGKTILLEKEGNNTPHIIPGIIVTGDVFVSSQTATQKLRTQMKADATEMEGAAVAQTCWLQHTPFLIIRSLSDNAGNNAYADVKIFYQVAARNAAYLVMAIADALK